MNFTQIVNEVIAITKRADKLSDIRRNVNSVLNQVCAAGDFARDHNELLVSLTPGEYAGSILLSALPRYRKINYILPTGYRRYLDPTDPRAVFTNCTQQQNAFYVSGDQINYNLSALVADAKVGYFQYPPTLTDASPDFWLLEVEPYCIIEGAAARTFTDIGDDASARSKEQLYRTQLSTVIKDHKWGVHYGA